jgi:hypothetical protein
MKRYEPHQIITFVMVFIFGCIMVILSHHTKAQPVYVNPDNEPAGFRPQLDYAMWAWNERIGSDLHYVGEHSGLHVEGAIVVTFPDFSQITGFGREPLRWGGGHRRWTYSGTDRTYSRELMINPILWTESNSRTLLHEFGHAFGIDHFDDLKTLMSPRGGVSVITTKDIGGNKSEYPIDPDLCWAEILPNYDLYVPYLQGFSAILKHIGNMQWRLADSWPVDDPGCVSAIAHDNGDVTVPDARGQFIRTSGEFIYQGGVTWRLEF